MLVVPISIARFASYAGARVPHGFTFLADLVFALGGQFSTTDGTRTLPLPVQTISDHGRRRLLGFANLLLFLGTRRFIPDVSTIPDFSVPRSRLDKASSRILGISPFVLAPAPRDLDTEAKPGMMVVARAVNAASDEEASVSCTDDTKADSPDGDAELTHERGLIFERCDASQGSIRPPNA